MLKIPLFLLLLFVSSVHAQQQPLPEVLALQTKLLQEINSSLACMAENAKLRADLEALKRPPPEPTK